MFLNFFKKIFFLKNTNFFFLDPVSNFLFFYNFDLKVLKNFSKVTTLIGDNTNFWNFLKERKFFFSFNSFKNFFFFDYSIFFSYFLYRNDFFLIKNFEKNNFLFKNDKSLYIFNKDFFLLSFFEKRNFNWIFLQENYFNGMFFAILFICGQYLEYFLGRFYISDGFFGSIFYMLTGLHGLHVLIGIFTLTIAWFKFNMVFSKHLLFTLSENFYFFSRKSINNFELDLISLILIKNTKSLEDFERKNFQKIRKSFTLISFFNDTFIIDAKILDFFFNSFSSKIQNPVIFKKNFLKIYGNTDKSLYSFLKKSQILELELFFKKYDIIFFLYNVPSYFNNKNIFFKSFNYFETQKPIFGFWMALWYWHFVDAVWLLLFLSVYIIAV